MFWHNIKPPFTSEWGLIVTLFLICLRQYCHPSAVLPVDFMIGSSVVFVHLLNKQSIRVSTIFTYCVLLKEVINHNNQIYMHNFGTAQKMHRFYESWMVSAHPGRDYFVY
jgi:hypothetical protein